MSKEAIERLVKLAMLYQDEGPGDHFRVDEGTSYWDYLLELQQRYAHAQRIHDEYQKQHGINVGLIVFKGSIDLLYVTEEPMRTDEHREEINREIEQLFASDEYRSLLPHDKAVACHYRSLKFIEADYHDFVQYVRHLVPARLKELPHKPDFMTEIPRDLPAFVQLVRTIESEARVQLASIKVESKEDVEPSLLYLFWLAREWQQREYWDNLRYTRLSLNSAYTELSAELRSAYFRVTSEIDQLCATTPRTLEDRRQSCDRICEVVSKSESGVRHTVGFYRELKFASVKLQDLELLVRQHVPEMLLHVPVIDDFVMEWDIDTFKVCNGMRAIECAARELATDRKSGEAHVHIVEFPSGGVMSKVIPSPQATALWQLHRTLSDLLFWAVRTDPEPLSHDWQTSIMATLRGQIDAALRSVVGDASLTRDLEKAESLAAQFSTLMTENPTLSTIPVQDWTVPMFRELFNDLAALDRKFAQLSEGDGQGVTQQAIDEATTRGNMGGAAPADRPHVYKEKRGERRKRLESQAIVLLRKHGSNRLRIANELGLNESTLREWQGFEDMRDTYIKMEAREAETRAKRLRNGCRDSRAETNSEDFSE